MNETAERGAAEQSCHLLLSRVDLLESRFEHTHADGDNDRELGEDDAAQAPAAQAFLDGVESGCVVDMAALEYISSAGLAILLKTQKRLSESGAAIKIINVNKHIYDIFRYSGFNSIFEIEPL